MNTEIEKLQGAWNIVALEVEGANIGPGTFKGSQIVLKGDQFNTIAMGAAYQGRFSVDDTTTPKTLDMLFTEGPHAGVSSLGIYELEGDTWKICLGFAGRDRPKEFVSTPGSGHVIETLQRASEDERANVSDEEIDPATPALLTSSPETEVDGGDLYGEERSRLEGEWRMVSGERSGQPLPVDFMQSGRRSTDNNNTTVTFGGQIYLKATYTLNAAAEPRTIDYTMTGGPFKGMKQYGIYEWEGDVVRFCFALPGKDRPTEFATVIGDERTLSVWRKEV